ncbi:SDR family oxidoreductase [Nocardioides sp. WS12]|uniref:SDR family oxidoreductase n=1 Tax=Nocardioides sp. WS12 TaxID=2486272 RepID=UPI001F23683B|nr:SDR family oxidoreductase [Nocardioides sp. WS12]
MNTPVIVATARSPIGRAGRGSFTSMRADDLAACPDPAPTVGAPREMADAAAFFASDEAAYITGVILPIDGGIAI